MFINSLDNEMLPSDSNCELIGFWESILVKEGGEELVIPSKDKFAEKFRRDLEIALKNCLLEEIEIRERKK